MQPRLERDPANKMLSGVCGGIGRYLQIDPTIVRLVFVVATAFGGFGLLAYIVLLVIMPNPGQAAPGTPGGPDLNQAVGSATNTLRDAFNGDGNDAERTRASAGWILVALGAIFLVSNSGILRGFDGRFAWPLVLVAVGVWLIVRRTAR